MKKIILLLAILLLTLLSSCVYHKHFTLCYAGADNGISKKCRVDGYYSAKAEDSRIASFLIYSDGTLAFSRIFFEKRKDLEDYLVKDSSEVSGNGNMEWGVYTLHGDTIQAQNVYWAKAFNYFVRESWYTILDSNRIALFKEMNYEMNDNSYYENNKPYFKNHEHYYDTPWVFSFVPFKQKPPSNNWLRKRKWYNCRGDK